MVCKLLKICSVFALLLEMEFVESLEKEGSGENTVLIKANTADVSIKGEVKGIISVEFDKEKKELQLFEDNGKEADEAFRTFSFKIKTMTGTGAKLKLEGKNGLLFNEEERCWSLPCVDGCAGKGKVINIEFRLKGRDKEGQLEQRGWDEDGCCYTFKKYDEIGEWRIIAHPSKGITNEESGIYKGSLTVSIVAA